MSSSAAIRFYDWAFLLVISPALEERGTSPAYLFTFIDSYSGGSLFYLSNCLSFLLGEGETIEVGIVF